jgi:hypothetical protein
VFRDRIVVNRFAWPKVIKMSYKGPKFSVKVRRCRDEKTDSTVSFGMCDRQEAARFWKICIEQHCFFRFETMDGEKKETFALPMPIFGSHFRYAGRTLHEVQC